MPQQSQLAKKTAPTPRILFIQHASVFEAYGGVEYYLHDLVALATKAYSSDNVMTLVPGRFDDVPEEPPYTMQIAPYPRNKVARKIQNRIPAALYFSAQKAIRDFRPTVLFNAHVSLGPALHLLGASYDIPIYTCAYGIDVWGDLWPQDEWCLRKVSRIISISHWTKKILVDRGYDASRIEIIQPRLPPHFENVHASDVGKRPHLNLLTMSRLDANEQYKGQDHVLHALHTIRQRKPGWKVRYVILGNGNDRGRLEALVESLNLRDCVQFREAVKDRETLGKAYAETDLYIMPSRFGRLGRTWKGEGFGIVYLEAAAFGIPSIAYNCGGATDILRDGENGRLIEPDNIEALADAIQRLDENRKELAKLGKTARTQVMSRFTESPILQQLKLAFR